MDIKKLHNKKFNLYGTTWTIKIVDNIEEEENNGDTHYYWGMTYNDRRVIEIAKNIYGVKVSNNEMFRTLCHELVHAILDTGNYTCTHDEPMVEFLGRGIVELVRQSVLCK